STTVAPIGRVVGTRSGDKGGDANLGVYARTDEGWAWLDNTLTVDLVRALLPEAAELPIERYRFPAIRSLNFVIRGLLEEGVAASTRQDPQAKALGEWLRAKVLPIPTSVLEAPID
ncbi:MAG: AtuA-related protein, partial [Acidimicrobiales bacterium]